MSRPALSLAVTLGVLLACGNPQTGLHVVIDGPAESAKDFDLLEVRLVDESSVELGRETLREADLPGGLPLRLNFLSAGRARAGTAVVVSAEAYLQDRLTWRAEGATSFQRGSGGSLALMLAPAAQTQTTPTVGCMSGDDCPTGFCAQGVCCVSACAGGCEACNQPGHLGECLPIPAGLVCGNYKCDGVRGICPNDCETSEECAAPAVCGQGTCRITSKLGEACGVSADCIQGSCVDSVCCRESCSQPCSRCMAGSGECGPKPAGTTAPTCNPYVCDGTSLACSSRCAQHSDCSGPSFGCRDGQCVPRLGSFTDNFDVDSRSRWPRTFSQFDYKAFVRDGTMQLTSVPNLAGTILIGTDDSYDGRETSIQIELRVAPNPNAAVDFGFHRNLSDLVTVGIYNGSVFALARKITPGVPGMSVPLAELPFNPQMMRFFRISTSGGMTYWDYSADGSSFLPLHQQADTFDYSRVGVYLSMLVPKAQPGTITAAFDNLNTR